MGLYDRNYTNAGSFASERSAQGDVALINFVKTTYKFFGASLFFAFIGAIIGIKNLEFVGAFMMPLIVAEFIALFGLMFSRSKPGLNIAMLFIFTTLTGVVIAPLLVRVGMQSGFETVAVAFAMATIVFGVMSLFGIKTSRDLANMGKMLFISLIIVFIGSIINLFLGNSMLQVIISGAAVVLFSLYVAYDTQNIIRGLYASPVDAAISLYLDFYNLFVHLLSLIGISRD